ncbi:hypothetical protein L1987_36584 [Smallanthus sonchifolius]|uniref:Uncharacterized protein n=1 Tax=Smallanthus sonchifolius TaxID=185202 RepID=A0ACB9HFD3_9ASTR|nr:hypothetical protein L1987_36584 [Smallanthus sonchifolius]
MATVCASPSISCCPVIKPHKNPNTLFPASVSSSTVSCSLPIRLRLAHRCISIPNSYPNSSVFHNRMTNLKKIRSSVAEEETVIPEQEEEESSSSQGEVEATVAVPISRSDMLTMFFKAEGTMSEAAIPAVTSALEVTEDVSNLRVQVLEGIASVELKKKTTVQATGVASNLVEILQSSGFKLQTLSLSFDDDTN